MSCPHSHELVRLDARLLQAWLLDRLRPPTIREPDDFSPLSAETLHAIAIGTGGEHEPLLFVWNEICGTDVELRVYWDTDVEGDHGWAFDVYARRRGSAPTERRVHSDALNDLCEIRAVVGPLVIAAMLDLEAADR